MQTNLINGVCKSVHYLFFYVMALSKSAGFSTLQGFPTLPIGPNHLSSLFKFPHREFGKKQIIKCWSALVTQPSSHGFLRGIGYTTMKIVLWCFVILVS